MKSKELKYIFFRPESFEDPSARRFADHVANGKIDQALESASELPDGVNTFASDGVSALLIAVERGNRMMVAELLKADANPNGGPDRAPISMALEDNNIDMLEMLLKSGADPNGRLQKPALMKAAMHDYLVGASMLLDYGANVDIQDRIGRTAVMDAASSESWNTANLLLDRGANIWLVAPASGLTMPVFAINERLDPNHPRGQARERAIRKIKAAGFPWPPPHPKEVKRLLSEGKWPPHQAK